MSSIVTYLTGFVSLSTFLDLIGMFAPYIAGAIAFGFVVNIIRQVVRLGRKKENVY